MENHGRHFLLCFLIAISVWANLASADPMQQQIMGDVLELLRHKLEKNGQRNQNSSRVPSQSNPNATYSVGGIKLEETPNLDSGFACVQMRLAPDLTHCTVTTREVDSRGGYSRFTTLILDENARAQYVNRVLMPAFFAPGEINSDLDDLSRKFGEKPRLMTKSFGAGRSAVIAVWGNVSLQPATEREDGDGDQRPIIRIDFLNDLVRSRRNSLPIFRPTGGAGFIWIASDIEGGLGRLRFMAVNPSAIPEGMPPSPPPAKGPPSPQIAENATPIRTEPPQRSGGQIDAPSIRPVVPEITTAPELGKIAQAAPAPSPSLPVPAVQFSQPQGPSPAPTISGPAEDNPRLLQFLTLLLWASLAGCVALTVAGASKKVIIFKDQHDLWTSFVPCVLPVVMLFVLSTLMPDGSKPANFESAITSDPVVLAVFALATILYLACFIRIFAVSIASNGPLLGIVVAVFKIIASAFLGVAIALSVFGYFNAKTDRASLQAVLIGALSAWLLKSLVNGQEVLERRAALVTIPQHVKTAK